jgi:hypothetical protein
VFEITLKQREELKLIEVGDRVAIVARSGRVAATWPTKARRRKVIDIKVLDISTKKTA